MLYLKNNKLKIQLENHKLKIKILKKKEIRFQIKISLIMFYRFSI